MKNQFLDLQKDELNGFKIYSYLASKSKGKNKEILSSIAIEEAKHYKILKDITKVNVKENFFLVALYKFLAVLFGVTFVIKLMEKSEEKATDEYESLIKAGYESFAKEILVDEEKHENTLIQLIEEERVDYVSSIVLGLNDALVEITGTISGLSSALQNSKTIGVAGLITGIAASFSMAASEYISKKTDIKTERSPLKAAFYTFFAYFLVVILLVLPFFFLSNYYIAFLISIVVGVAIITIFSFYIAIVQDKSFLKSFMEMVLVVFGVVLLTFLIGLLARSFLHVNI